MLDTNTVTYVALSRSQRAASRLIAAQDESPLYLSVISEAEIFFGFAKRPEATRVADQMNLVLGSMIVLPWTTEAAFAYGALRAKNERLGINVGNLDMLIAAHALAEGAVLITGDRAIGRLVGGPETVNWADDLRPN